MSCSRCPHHVRHGKVGPDGQSIEFKNLCGLRLRQFSDAEAPPRKGRGRGRPGAEAVKRKPLPDGATLECLHHPFPEEFDYLACATYQEIFATKGLRNVVMPTKDFQYSDQLAGVPVTDMELL